MQRLGYVPALDGLRAGAILLVLGLHFFNFPPGGAVGVDLFFVLSGFLITTLLLEERETAGQILFRAFYIRRARRLFPALAALLVAFFVVSTAAGGHPLVTVTAGAFYFTNILIASGHGALGDRLGRLWSLAQEEQFYLLWPGLLLILGKSGRLVMWLIVLAAVLAVYRASLVLDGASGIRVYFGPDTHADGLVVGAALAAARRRWGLAVGEWAGQLGCAAILPASVVGWQFVRPWAIWGEPLFEIAAALLIAAAVSETALSSGLSSKPMVWIGQRSYSLYLWMGTILAWSRVLFGQGPMIRIGALGVVFVVAALSYRFVEQPFRRRITAPAQTCTEEPREHRARASVDTGDAAAPA